MAGFNAQTLLGIVQYTFELRWNRLCECGQHVDIEQLGQRGIRNILPRSIFHLKVFAFIVPPGFQRLICGCYHGTGIIVQVVAHGVTVHILVPARVKGQQGGYCLTVRILRQGRTTSRTLAEIAHGVDGVLVVEETVILTCRRGIIIGCRETVDKLRPFRQLRMLTEHFGHVGHRLYHTVDSLDIAVLASYIALEHLA